LFFRIAAVRRRLIFAEFIADNDVALRKEEILDSVDKNANK
jgi:hypothetical protein